MRQDEVYLYVILDSRAGRRVWNFTEKQDSSQEEEELIFVRQMFAVEFPSWLSRKESNEDCEVAGLIPGLAQWVQDLVLL